jgi:hypothetical protein
MQISSGWGAGRKASPRFVRFQFHSTPFVQSTRARGLVAALAGLAPASPDSRSGALLLELRRVGAGLLPAGVSERASSPAYFRRDYRVGRECRQDRERPSSRSRAGMVIAVGGSSVARTTGGRNRTVVLSNSARGFTHRVRAFPDKNRGGPRQETAALAASMFPALRGRIERSIAQASRRRTLQEPRRGAVFGEMTWDTTFLLSRVLAFSVKPQKTLPCWSA